jgi:hypothetical protein
LRPQARSRTHSHAIAHTRMESHTYARTPASSTARCCRLSQWRTERRSHTPSADQTYARAISSGDVT